MRRHKRAPVAPRPASCQYYLFMDRAVRQSECTTPPFLNRFNVNMPVNVWALHTGSLQNYH